MMALGVLSIGAVVFVSQLFKKSGPDRSDARLEALADDVRRLRDNSDSRSQTILKRLDQIESTVRDIQQRSATPPAAVPAPATAPGLSPVQDALTRGWGYVAKHEFDAKDHDRVLAELVAAYGVKGLSPEMNNSLSATIQQVNEIGVARVISDARNLPTTEAVQRLRAFLQATPRLTQGQNARVNSAIAAYRQGP
jgi:hypothetical protein